VPAWVRVQGSPAVPQELSTLFCGVPPPGAAGASHVLRRLSSGLPRPEAAGGSVYASPLLCAVFSRLRPGRTTRYGWVARPYSTGTFTREETPSFPWRDNAGHHLLAWSASGMPVRCMPLLGALSHTHDGCGTGIPADRLDQLSL
jgi:hypothetical protein